VIAPQAGRSLLVTAIDAATSTIACQLAGVFAETGRRTCFVDAADEPSSSAVLEPSASGAVEPEFWINAEESRVVPLTTDVANLVVLPLRQDRGASADLVTIERARRLTKVLAEDREWIVWAGPGVTSSAGMALAGAVEGVVLVVSPGRTTRHAARRALEAIAAVRGRLLGTILSEG
jgi:Mrp family chromosome partitioning ATPase